MTAITIGLTRDLLVCEATSVRRCEWEDLAPPLQVHQRASCPHCVSQCMDSFIVLCERPIKKNQKAHVLASVWEIIWRRLAQKKEKEGTGWLLGLGEHCNRRQTDRQLLLFFPKDLLFLFEKEKTQSKVLRSMKKLIQLLVNPVMCV